MRAVHRRYLADRPVDLAAQLGNLRRGTGDPTWRTTGDGAIWRTTRTPDGPGLERLLVRADQGSVEQAAWGPGAQWLADRLPRLLGELDDPTGFDPPNFLVLTARRFAGWRVGRTERLLEALIPAILEQRVTGKEAWRAWRLLVTAHGEPAPGPAEQPHGLRVFPDPQVWGQIPSWEWHQAGVDSARSAAALRAIQVADQLEAAANLPVSVAHERLRSVHGIGIWTAAETAQRALGDADAVSYRDFHVAKEVVYAFTGRLDGTDAEMAGLLLPYAGHRYRIQRLIELSGRSRPRRGPRLTIQDMRNM